MADPARLRAAGAAPSEMIQAAINRLKQQPCRYPVGQHLDVRELPSDGGYRAMYRVHPDPGRDETAGDVLVLRVFGPGQSRDRL